MTQSGHSVDYAVWRDFALELWLRKDLQDNGTKKAPPEF